MRIKQLVQKMGRDTVENLCKEKNWKLLTEADITEEIKDKVFWIEGYADSEGELRPLFYNAGKIETLHKNFMINIIVLREDRICPGCGYNCEKENE